MYKNNTISVSIPAFNEEKLILDTLKGIPDYIDYIVVVNDASVDSTKQKILHFQKNDSRVHFIDSKENEGVGASIIKAHRKGIKLGADILVVMAGDNQMDPQYIPDLLSEIVENECDFVKCNRFFHTQSLKKMPFLRLFGNLFISFLIKICSGYYSIADPLNGYTAIRSKIYKKIDQDLLKKRYDFEISLILALYLLNARLKDIFVPARYAIEKSKIQGLSFKNKNSYLHSIIRTSITLFKGLYKRITLKYFLFSLHPFILFFVSGLFLFLWGIGFGMWIIYESAGQPSASPATVMLSGIPFILGIQFLLQAFIVDIQNEPH